MTDELPLRYTSECGCIYQWGTKERTGPLASYEGWIGVTQCPTHQAEEVAVNEWLSEGGHDVWEDDDD